MKKFVYGALFLALVGISITSCEQMEVTALENQERPVYELRKEKSGYFKYTLKWSAGHDKGPECVGSDFCITFIMNSGTPVFIEHLPCVGPGNNCDHTVTIGFQANDNTVDIDFMNPLYHEKETYNLDEGMSMYTEAYAAWLNVPKQVLEQNNDNLFVGKNISFTENPIYSVYEIVYEVEE